MLPRGTAVVWFLIALLFKTAHQKGLSATEGEGEKKKDK